MIEAGVAEKVLLVGAEKLHWVMDNWDRNTCILFGDGAGAAVLEPSTAGDGVLATDLGADGTMGKTMLFPTLGTRGEFTNSRDPFEHRLHFEGQAVFKIAVKGMEQSVRRALGRADVAPEEVSLVVPHEANERIIDAAARRLGIDRSKVVVNISTHGNSAAASIPMALADALDEGRVNPGDIVVQTAFGGGVTWGSTVIRWGDRVEPLGHSDRELPPCDQTVFRAPPTQSRLLRPDSRQGPSEPCLERAPSVLAHTGAHGSRSVSNQPRTSRLVMNPTGS